MKRIAIIPARSGSKRIPNKNIVDFHGIPLLYWTIDAARESDLFDRILVSTDSQHYLNLAKKRDIKFPLLRGSHSDDNSPVSLATLETLKKAMEYYGETYDSVVQLMPNCPLRTSSSIREFIYDFENENNSSLISGFEYGWMNPNWAYKINENNKPAALFPENISKRSQDLPKLYCPSGSIWVTNTKNLLACKTFYLKDWRFKIIPWEEAIDIDDYNDLKMAELVFEMRKKKKFK